MSRASRVTLLGAVDEVTGSCTLVDTPDARVLVDLGLAQGVDQADTRNLTLPDIDLRWLDAVAVTHAHVDHCGRLPMLVPHGWRGPVFCSEPTADLLRLILPASARLQRTQLAEWTTRKERGIEVPDAPPPVLYGQPEVDALLDMLVPLRPDETASVGTMTIGLQSAGHILGASSVVLDTSSTRIVCSGDLGRRDAPPIPDPTPCPPCDAVVMECTKGGDVDAQSTDPVHGLRALLARAQLRGGPVIMPSFALGRTQQVLFALREIAGRGELPMSVYLDSALAARATAIHAHWPDGLHPEATHGLDDPLHFDGLFMLRSRRASKRIDALGGPAVIMAGNGFGQGGPILRHLARWLPDPDATIALTGYCMPGTLVGYLETDPPFVLIDGKRVDVHATIDVLDCFGGHADGPALTQWATAQAADATIILNHGEAESRASLAAHLQAKGCTVCRPALGDPVEI